MADNDSDLDEYTVEINGIDHILLLDEETATRLYGDKARKGTGSKAKASGGDVEGKAVTSPANKSRTGTNK